MDKLTASKIHKLHTQVIELWHSKEDLINSWDDAARVLGSEHEGIYKLIYENQLINCFQWHEEDKSRLPQATGGLLAEVKREIDRSNQRRTDKMEEIDGYLVNWLANNLGQPNEDMPLNSETPGSLIDRLSILALKIYHMQKETERREAQPANILRCQKKLEVLLEQQEDLGRCLDELIDDLTCGKKRLKVYYQLKMYNDPETNPAIYLNLKSKD